MKLNTEVKRRLDDDLPRLLAAQSHPREYNGLSDAQCAALENILAG